MLFRRTSARQEIALIRERDGSLSLTLDDYWQFSSRDEHVFHEVLVDPAMSTAPQVGSVLILGGGDGLAARNVLRYPQVERVVLCEIDPVVIEMTTSVPELVELCGDSLRDPRVEVVTEDALVFLPRCAEVFDVVVCDFPVAASPGAAALYGPSFYGTLARVVGERGVVSVQVSLDPDGFWPVLDAISATFPWVQPRLVELADDTWADVVLASAMPHEPVRPLASGLRFLTPRLLETLLIRNRGGDGFETDQYGTRPDFFAERSDGR